MRIFVAGATGAIGSRLLPRLVHAGHTVSGLTRTPAKADVIRGQGAEPIVADALDEQSIRAAVFTAKPDVIVHELTDLKGDADFRHFDRTFANSNRLRTEGTDHLLAAARDAGVRRLVAQSYCGWPYARSGGYIKSENEPLDSDPTPWQRRTLEAIRHLEHVVTTSAAPEGVVLRYGAFYGPGTGMFDSAFITQIKRRHVPLIGGGTGWWSFVHIDDAAAATALAVERGSGIYNIVDDEPAPVHAWLPALAEMLDARPPFRLPRWLASIAAGETVTVMMTQSRAGSNARAKREFGWQPHHASWRQGFAELAQQETRAAA